MSEIYVCKNIKQIHKFPFDINFDLFSSIVMIVIANDIDTVEIQNFMKKNKFKGSLVIPLRQKYSDYINKHYHVMPKGNLQFENRLGVLNNWRNTKVFYYKDIIKDKPIEDWFKIWSTWFIWKIVLIASNKHSDFLKKSLTECENKNKEKKNLTLDHLCIFIKIN
jgi:hypothetical protein